MRATIRPFLAIILGLALLGPASAWAKKMYVVDGIVLTVRHSKAATAEVVARIKSLESVEVLRGDDDWAYVRTEAGAEGWIQRKYLVAEPPAGLALRQTQAENQKLAARLQELEAENARLKELGAELDRQLKAEVTAKTKLEADYRQLGNDAKAYLELKKRYEEAKVNLAQLKAEVERLTQDASQSVNSRRLKWFLAGGAVLVAGWLVGVLSARRRKTPSRFA
jgi:SH3 domain protein